MSQNLLKVRIPSLASIEASFYRSYKIVQRLFTSEAQVTSYTREAVILHQRLPINKKQSEKQFLNFAIFHLQMRA